MSTDSTSGTPQRKAPYARRFRFLMIAVIAIALIYTAAWFAGSIYVRSTLTETLAALTTPQTEAHCGDIGVWGFPFRYDVTCTNLGWSDGDVTVTLPELKATALVYRPTHVQLFAEGPAGYTDAFTGTEREIGWESLRASARSNGWSFARVSLEAENITISDTLIGSTELASIGHLQLHALDSPEKFDAENQLTELAVFAAAEAADIADLAITDGQLVLEAEVPGIPADMRNWSLPVLVRNWQEYPVNILRLEADDPVSSISINGRLSTDAEAYLEGDFDLTTTNIYEPLSATIAPQMLEIFLGQPNDDGSRYRAYAVRHGVLMAGNVPVMSVPPLL